MELFRREEIRTEIRLRLIPVSAGNQLFEEQTGQILTRFDWLFQITLFLS
jgi:hypothetical protein